MKVDIRRISQDPLVVEVDDDIAGCVYITINGRVYYIDDSTNEQIVSRWPECDCTDICYCAHDVYDLIPVAAGVTAICNTCWKGILNKDDS